MFKGPRPPGFSYPTSLNVEEAGCLGLTRLRFGPAPPLQMERRLGALCLAYYMFNLKFDSTSIIHVQKSSPFGEDLDEALYSHSIVAGGLELIS